MSSTSEIWSPTLNTGLRHEVGCWKIIEMRLPRMCVISDSGSSSMSAPVEQNLALDDLARVCPPAA